MIITTKKEFFAKSEQLEVIRTAHNMNCIEDWDDIVANARTQLAEQGCPEHLIKLDNDKLSFGTQFIMKPRTARVLTGIIEKHSKHFVFKYTDNEGNQSTSRCDLTSDQYLENNKFIVPTLLGGEFHYEIKSKACHCHNCGDMVKINHNGTANHITNDGEINYDRDAETHCIYQPLKRFR